MADPPEDLSFYAPPQAKLVGSGALSDSDTWTYPLSYKVEEGIAPWREIRDAEQRLLWLAEVKPIQRIVTLQALRNGEAYRSVAKIRSVRRQIWVLQAPDTNREIAYLQRIGGCFPSLFTLRQGWIAKNLSGARERIVLRSTGPAWLRWWASKTANSDPPAAVIGRQKGLSQADLVAEGQATVLTVHGSGSAPPFLRVRQHEGSSFLIERLEGEPGQGAERLAHEVLFLMLAFQLLS